jgi:radical SAM protein with 4Fe4S-binding SPASM domain
MQAKKIIRSFGFHYEYFPESVPSGQCIAQSADDIIFNHEGSMKKCPREVEGDGGEVLGDGQLNVQASFYRNSKPADDQDCRKCSYLPVCHGGCVNEFYHEPESKANRCSLWKYTLQDELTNYMIDQVEKQEAADA